METSHHPMELAVLGMGYALLSCWTKGFYRNSQTAQAIDKAIGCSVQADGKALLFKTTFA